MEQEGEADEDNTGDEDDSGDGEEDEDNGGAGNHWQEMQTSEVFLWICIFDLWITPTRFLFTEVPLVELRLIF